MRSVALLLVACLAAVSAVRVSAQPAGAPPPKLILVIVADQMRADFVDRFAALYTSGFKTLAERGAVFTNAHYRHASTETGPGHSVLLTGSHPSHSGIVGNDWWDPFLKRVINVVDDPVQQTLGGAGRRASPANQLTFTVGDVLKSRNPRTRVVGVAMKDRSSILMVGRRADAAYWFENDGGNFVTSSYYMDAAPPWMVEWNARRSVDRFASAPWTRLVDDPGMYDKYAGPDEVEGERDRKDIRFPHHFTAKPPSADHYVELRRTPFIDEIVLDFATEVMARHDLGKDDDTDVFAVSFAGPDGVGHQYGPDSHEELDTLLRLDLVLGRLLARVDAEVGLDRTLVVLSSDHGSRPLVEVSQAKGVAARRFAPKQMQAAIAAKLAERFPGIAGLMSHFATDVYLDDEVIRRHGLARKDVEAAVTDALMATGVVERVYSVDDLRHSTSSDPMLGLFRNAFFAPRSPDLHVMLKRDVWVSSGAGGTGHGTVYEFDTGVPVIFAGPGIKAGRYDVASGPEDIAPTIAYLLNIEFPREPDSRLLLEMLAR